MGSNKIEYSVSNDPLKTLDITNLTKEKKREIKYPPRWGPGNFYSICDDHGDSVCGRIKLNLAALLCFDNRVRQCCFSYFSTKNTNRKITFVYTFDKKQGKGKNEVMPGLRLTWRTMQREWPDRFLELSELGRTVKSPDYGNHWTNITDWGQRRQPSPGYEDFVHTNYRSYSVVLHLTSEVVQKVNKEGKLVVQIETDTQEGDVFVEEGLHKWEVFQSLKTWQQAEDQCVGYGGHLASVTRRDEIVGAQDCWIGLNGTKDEGWRWTDGSTWDFANWANGNVYGKENIHKDCCTRTLSDGSWMRGRCNRRLNCFVCSFKNGRRSLRGKQNLTLEYKPSELPLPLINITFVYNDTQTTQDKIKSGSKIPGFRVSWRAPDETSAVTEVDEVNWKHHLFHPKQREVSFLLTTSLVTEVWKEQTTLSTLMEKASKIKSEYEVVHCEGGHKPESMFLNILESLKREMNASMSIKTAYPSRGAIQGSLRLYFLLSQCSEEGQKAVEFVKRHRHRPATLLQATVNSLAMNRFQESSTRVHFRKFYSVLEKELELEHARVLLALGSPVELRAILERDLPYLGKPSS